MEREFIGNRITREAILAESSSLPFNDVAQRIGAAEAQFLSCIRGYGVTPEAVELRLVTRSSAIFYARGRSWRRQSREFAGKCIIPHADNPAYLTAIDHEIDTALAARLAAHRVFGDPCPVVEVLDVVRPRQTNNRYGLILYPWMPETLETHYDKRYLLKRPYTSQELHGIAHTIAATLSVLHAHKIYSLDLTPKQMLFAHGNDSLAKRLRMTDFGNSLQVAQHLMDHVDITLGTTPYAAPEQYAPKMKLYSDRTDVYALGTLLYQLLGDSLDIVPRSHYYELFATHELGHTRTLPEAFDVPKCRTDLLTQAKRRVDRTTIYVRLHGDQQLQTRELPQKDFLSFQDVFTYIPLQAHEIQASARGITSKELQGLNLLIEAATHANTTDRPDIEEFRHMLAMAFHE